MPRQKQNDNFGPDGYMLEPNAKVWRSKDFGCRWCREHKNGPKTCVVSFDLRGGSRIERRSIICDECRANNRGQVSCQPNFSTKMLAFYKDEFALSQSQLRYPVTFPAEGTDAAVATPPVGIEKSVASFSAPSIREQILQKVDKIRKNKAKEQVVEFLLDEMVEIVGKLPRGDQNNHIRASSGSSAKRLASGSSGRIEDDDDDDDGDDDDDDERGVTSMERQLKRYRS